MIAPALTPLVKVIFSTILLWPSSLLKVIAGLNLVPLRKVSLPEPLRVIAFPLKEKLSLKIPPARRMTSPSFAEK